MCFALSLGSLLASVDTIYLILNCCILSISLDPFYDISLWVPYHPNYFLNVPYQVESNIVRCPDPEYAEKMIAAIDAVRVRGDSVGGVVTCIVRNCPRVCSIYLSHSHVHTLCKWSHALCMIMSMFSWTDYYAYVNVYLNCCQFESSSFCGFYTFCGCSAEGWSTSIIVCQGLGSPVFDKLEAELAKAMMSLPATKGFEVGSGFAGWEFICYFVFIGLLL